MSQNTATTPNSAWNMNWYTYSFVSLVPLLAHLLEWETFIFCSLSPSVAFIRLCTSNVCVWRFKIHLNWRAPDSIARLAWLQWPMSQAWVAFRSVRNIHVEHKSYLIRFKCNHQYNEISLIFTVAVCQTLITSVHTLFSLLFLITSNWDVRQSFFMRLVIDSVYKWVVMIPFNGSLPHVSLKNAICRIELGIKYTNYALQRSRSVILYGSWYWNRTENLLVALIMWLFVIIERAMYIVEWNEIDPYTIYPINPVFKTK